MRSLLVFPACLVVLLAVASVPSQAQEEPVAEAVAKPAPTNRATPKLRPLTVAAGLTDDSSLTGTLTDSTAISVKTAFGEASIPLSEVAGIRFPAAEDTSTTIVMLNGDSITGATDVKFLNIETTWGSAKINGQAVATMLFVPGLKWQTVENLGGKRWSLVEATAPAQNNAPVQQASGTINNGVPQNIQPRVIFGR